MSNKVRYTKISEFKGNKGHSEVTLSIDGVEVKNVQSFDIDPKTGYVTLVFSPENLCIQTITRKVEE